MQRCSYCDFATYVHTEIRPPQDYVALLKKEIHNKKNLFLTSGLPDSPREVATIYFGGGTPSLIDANLLVSVLDELKQCGFRPGASTEISIEINPATVDERKLQIYLEAGVNRFSVGAQTFSDRLLKMVRREHNAEQTRQTLALLRKNNVNFSFDLLFALPSQTLVELRDDISEALDLGSQHISPYCLTVPESHPLSQGRPPEAEQVEMFELIHSQLEGQGFRRYEISNYARPGFESRHNLLYWTDQEYWGLGLSAHSYARSSTQKNNQLFGRRFWNLNTIELYAQQVNQMMTDVPDLQSESLLAHQALTDFCHTSLRLSSGLSLSKLRDKFQSEKIVDIIVETAQSLLKHKLIFLENDHFRLTDAGVLVSNQVFNQFTFLSEDLA